MLINRRKQTQGYSCAEKGVGHHLPGLPVAARPQCDQVSLSFESGALDAIAEKAIDRQIGARGLRAIMEDIMTNIMYEIPSDPTIQSVLITEDCVRNGSKPVVTRDASKPRTPIRNAGVTL